MDFFSLFPAFISMGIGERIKNARNQSGLSQADLARAVGRSQSAVAEWETGDTEPRRNIVDKIAEALGVNAIWLEAGGVSEDGLASQYHSARKSPPANARSHALTGQSDALVPVYAAVISESDPESLQLGNVVEHRARPGQWKNVKGLYGVYIPDEAMAPRVNTGELIWVHPDRRPAPGQETLFADRKAGSRRVVLRVFVGQTAAKWIVGRLNPKRESDLKKADWDCQLVVGIDLNR